MPLGGLNAVPEMPVGENWFDRSRLHVSVLVRQKYNLPAELELYASEQQARSPRLKTSSAELEVLSAELGVFSFRLQH